MILDEEAINASEQKINTFEFIYKELNKAIGSYIASIKRGHYWWLNPSNLPIELPSVDDPIPTWNPDKQCMKCGDELHWVRMAMVCKKHGYTGKGC